MNQERQWTSCYCPTQFFLQTVAANTPNISLQYTCHLFRFEILVFVFNRKFDWSKLWEITFFFLTFNNYIIQPSPWNTSEVVAYLKGYEYKSETEVIYYHTKLERFNTSKYCQCEFWSQCFNTLGPRPPALFPYRETPDHLVAAS